MHRFLFLNILFLKQTFNTHRSQYPLGLSAVEGREEGVKFSPHSTSRGLRAGAAQAPDHVWGCHKDEGSQGSPSNHRPPLYPTLCITSWEPSWTQPGCHLLWEALHGLPKSALMVKSCPITLGPLRSPRGTAGFVGETLGKRGLLVGAMEQCEPIPSSHPSWTEASSLLAAEGERGHRDQEDP